MPERPIKQTIDDREDELRRLAEEEKKKEAEKVADATKPKESFFTRLAHRIRDGFRKITDALKTMAGVEHNKIVLGRKNYNEIVKKEYEASHREGKADILNVSDKSDIATSREAEPDFDDDWLDHIDESDIPPGYVTEDLSVEDAYEAFMSVDKENDNHDDFIYEINENNEVVITKYIGNDENLIIPSEIDGKPVTEIGESAFENCSLTSVTIPDSVTSIGNGAFAYCGSLTSVTIPDSVTSIGVSAFSNCSSLTSVTIPDSVTSMGKWVFWDCSNLTSVTIPDGVTFIGDSAFKNCSKLTSITIPDSVTSIGERAFERCRGLTSITIPDSVMSIGDDAFKGCDDSVIIHCNPGSYAERWAMDNGLSVETIPVEKSVVEEKAEVEPLLSEPAAPKAEKAVCLDAESYKRAVDSGKYTEVSLMGGKSVVEVTAYKDGVGWAFRDGAGNPISGGKVDKIVKNHSAIKDISRASTSIGKDIIGEAKDKLDRSESAFEPRLYIYQDRAVLVEADKGVIDITPQTAEHETPQEFRIKDSANKVGMAISNAFTAPDRESLDAPDSIEGEPDVSNIIDYHDFSFIDDTVPGDVEMGRDENER